MGLNSLGPKPPKFKKRPHYTPNQGYWCAWIAGKNRSLCRWTIRDLKTLDEIYALKKEHYESLAQKSAQETAQKSLSTVEKGKLHVKDLIERYLAARLAHVDHRDLGKRLSPVTFTNYQYSLRWLDKQIGGVPIGDLNSSTFTLVAHHTEARFSVIQFNSIVSHTRMMFHWAMQNELIDKLPTYGTEFVSSHETVKVDAIRQKPMKLFTAEQIRAMLDHADKNMKAMILLGINCAYLQSDCAELKIDFGNHPSAKLHLGEDPYIRFDRIKTGERRKATLWPETVEALKTVIGDRKDGLVFMTRKGLPILHQTAVTNEAGAVTHYANCDPTVKKFRELCKRAGLRTKEGDADPMFGLGFSSLRTTCETVAFTCQQLSVAHQAAIAWIMGHRLSGVNLSRMADRYLQDIDNSTLALVTSHVHDWLFKSSHATVGPV